MDTIVKATTKGQITIPAKWRRNFDTNQFLIKDKGEILEIRPLFLRDLEKKKNILFLMLFETIKAKELKLRT